MPKVSIIIPVYNVSSYLRRTMDSAINQTLKDIEIIIIDDGSTDDSLEIAEQYALTDNRLVIQTGENQGLPKARLKGFSLATSPYIYHLDGDDFITYDAMETLYKKAITENADMVFFDLWRYEEKQDKKTLYPSISWETMESIQLLEQMYLSLIPWSAWSHMHKRSLYDNIEMHFLEGLSIGEDAMLTSMLVYASKKNYKVNLPLYNYVVREDSMTQEKKLSDQYYNSYLIYPQRINDYFSRTSDYSRLKRALGNLYVRVAQETLYWKRYDKAHMICKKAMSALKMYPELKSCLQKRMYKLIRLYAVSQYLGTLYMKRCIKKNKI